MWQRGSVVGPNQLTKIEEELLVKYAAKRVWPEKAQSWEHQGESDTVEAFAAEFASVEQLSSDAEFVILARDGANPETRFFRVVSCSPYKVAPAPPRSGAEQSPGAQGTMPSGQDDAQETLVAAPSIQPVISMLLYMGKVGIVAALGIAAMIPVIAVIKRALGD
jgi:hypothetical protein